MVTFCGKLSCTASTPVFLTCGPYQVVFLADFALVAWSLNPRISSLLIMLQSTSINRSGLFDDFSLWCGPVASVEISFCHIPGFLQLIFLPFHPSTMCCPLCLQSCRMTGCKVSALWHWWPCYLDLWCTFLLYRVTDLLWRPGNTTL